MKTKKEKTTPAEKAQNTFVEYLIDRIEHLETKYANQWVTVKNGYPRNINGRYYQGINRFMLLLNSNKWGYIAPVYITFIQAKAIGVNITKGEKSFPVLYFSQIFRHKETKIVIDPSEYMNLSDEEKCDYFVHAIASIHNLFNISQTNLEEVNPLLWGELTEMKLPEKQNNFICQEIEKMLYANSWQCPINIKLTNNAYYNISTDMIICPDVSQFEVKEYFYQTILHEMAHSTGHPKRLNRFNETRPTKGNYAKEELIAELAGAMVGVEIEISNKVVDQNAMYLKSWLKELKKSPRYLYDILSDAMGASKMINDEFSKHKGTVK